MSFSRAEPRKRELSDGIHDRMRILRLGDLAGADGLRQCGAPCCDAPGCGEHVGPRDLDMICSGCVGKRDEVEGIPIAEYASAQARLLDLVEPFQCYHCGSTAEAVQGDRMTIGEADAACCRVPHHEIGRKPAGSMDQA